MRPVRLGAVLFIFVIAAFAGACAAGGGGEGGTTTDRYVITATELAPYATLNAYEGVRRLRRFWLQGQGGRSPRVFINGNELGGAPSLEEYACDQIVEMRFIQPNQAMTDFGPDYAGGIIQVTLR